MEKFHTYKEAIQRVSRELNEPSWFLDYRLKALEKLKELPLPEIERLDYSTWNLWQIPSLFTQKYKEISSEKIMTVKRATPSSIQVYDFQEAFSQKKEIFQEIYEENFAEWTDYFDAFTTAFLTEGIFIYIPADTYEKEGIELKQLLDNLKEENYTQQILIYAERNTNVEIIDHYVSDSLREKSLHLHVQVIAQEGARVQYSTLENLDKKTTAFIRRSGKTKNDAVINWSLGLLNQGNVLEDIQVSLAGRGSSSDMKAIALSTGRQVQAVNAQVQNEASHTIGNIFQHGVALEQSTITFNGIGKILRGAKESDAQQESRVLLLSDEARADTNPILLIDEYEIEAGHAASITRTNKEQLYYLMSRGLSRKEAEKLIIRGFLDIVLAEMPTEEVKEQLVELIERKLQHHVH